MEKIKIGVLREEKIPQDKRVPLTPLICSELLKRYSQLEIYIQPSTIRCYSDYEYSAFGLTLQEDLTDCDLLMGIKEVPCDSLLAGKKYFFFSHTIKKQPHNRKLLQALLKKQIQMIDYECLTDENNNRIIGFGRFAGIVGAYNGILAYGRKYDLFAIKPANLCRDKAEMEEELKRVKLPNIKIALTGGGRVANGAIETLSALRIRKITPEEYLMTNFREPVYCQLNPRDYVERKSDNNFDLHDFFAHPEHFKSKFLPFTKVTDLFISAHYWDPRSPKMLEINDMKAQDFRISVIADITCDINGSVPSTIRSSTINKPFYGFNANTEQETVPFHKETITIMAVDNLPCELPRDASDDFGRDLMERVFPSIVANDEQQIIKRASICKNGKLTDPFAYLNDYAY